MAIEYLGLSEINGQVTLILPFNHGYPKVLGNAI